MNQLTGEICKDVYKLRVEFCPLVFVAGIFSTFSGVCCYGDWNKLGLFTRNVSAV